MRSKLNISFQVDDEKNETIENSNVSIYVDALNEKTFMNIKLGLKDICNGFGNLIGDMEGEIKNDNKK